MKKAFTLIEMLIVTVILWIILTIILTIYFKMLDIKTDVTVRSNLVKSTDNLVEKLNIMMKNYTIDYEEYFNRKIVWCNSNWWSSFSWDVWTGWYCKKFTSYGNWNSIDSSLNTWNNILYYCTSHGNWWWTVEKPWNSDCEWNGSSGSNYIYDEKNSNNLSNGSWCVNSESSPWIESFWEYKLQFWDVKANADDNWWCKWDDDDTDLWIWPDAIADNWNIKELYLISKDWKKRIFFRRKLVWSWDFNYNWTAWDVPWERLYKLQMLKLRWFDIWSWHDADNIWKTFNDGYIDTWACDKKEWFKCNWADIGWWYNWYKLPANVNDGWADITSNDISVDKFNLTIYPMKSPDYAWSTWAYQIAPYIRMDLKTRFYPINYQRKINPETVMNYTMNIQTTFSVKPY